MKKLLIVLMSICLFTGVGFCGEDVTLPYNVNFSDTDKAERVDILFTFNSTGNHTATIKYSLWNSDRTEVVVSKTIVIEGTAFDNFVAGYGSTLQSRADALCSQDIQSRYSTTPK